MESFEPVGLVKTSCSSDRGIVVTKHPLATGVARDILAAGGNACDAAIAAAFALGVVEPYMSGIGGVGIALVGTGDDLTVLDGGPVSARNLDPDRYRVIGEAADSDLFGWPRVRDDANILGPSSVCVPTMVALMHALYEQGAGLPWPRLLEPAIELARGGYPVDWLLPLSILQDLDSLLSFPSTAQTYVPDGRVPAYDMDVPGGTTFRQEALARTLEVIAADWRALYEGELAGTIAASIQGSGGYLSEADLAAYDLPISRPISVPFAGVDVRLAGGLNGGPTIAEMLYIYDALNSNATWASADDLVAWVEAGSQAFHDRFAEMGHAGTNPAVGTREHALRHRAVAAATPTAPDGSTTYLTVVDGDECVVSMNLTLLSRWGSRYVIPDTGVLMNNGIMWFDPLPGRPNSLTPGARPLANMVPAIVMRDGRPVMTLGATGGRKILGAMAQILANVWKHGMTAQNAVAARRLELSTTPMVADSRFPDAVIREVERRTGRRLERYLPRLASGGYASPLT